MNVKTCADIEPLVTALVDGEAAPDERAAVAEHLAACRVCRSRADAERGARAILRARAPELRVQAPPAVRERCRAAAASRPAPVSRAAAWRRHPVAVPMTIAATLAMLLGGLTISSLSDRLQVALAAQLTLEHVKCFAFARPAGTTDPGPVAASLEREYGWSVKVPGGSPDQRLELLGARRCLYSEGQMAHLMYRLGGRPLSLFVLFDARHPEHVFEIMGHEAIVWTDQGRTYALVGPDSPTEMQRVATYVRSALR
jgi:anti-sigma factor RsiW